MSNKVDVDIESVFPNQQDMLAVTYKYQGKGYVQITGRQQGKSQITAFKRLWDDVMNANAKVTDIKLSEGTIYGSRYYTVEPVGGNWLDMETWCHNTFGKGTRSLWGEKKAPEPARRWYANNRKFWFRDEKDRDWFILRWSS